MELRHQRWGKNLAVDRADAPENGLSWQITADLP
jgi:hypothetical protein